MRHQRLIVLKFGGSVLTDEWRLHDAVGEIKRWRNRGWCVVAVVSALSGGTDDLILRCQRLGGGTSPLARAGVIANGEFQAAALLGLLLDGAGIGASVFTPGALDLRAHGDPLNATPCSLDTRPINEALAREGVVIVPGFVAIDDHGRIVTLGRGGSDLTAIFLAWQLRAERCRLVKDVDGLYEADPATTHPSPRRFARARFNDALATDGSIVQHKAVRFARNLHQVFELGSLDCDAPTIIGTPDRAFDVGHLTGGLAETEVLRA